MVFDSRRKKNAVAQLAANHQFSLPSSMVRLPQWFRGCPWQPFILHPVYEALLRTQVSLLTLQRHHSRGTHRSLWVRPHTPQTYWLKNPANLFLEIPESWTLLDSCWTYKIVGGYKIYDWVVRQLCTYSGFFTVQMQHARYVKSAFLKI